MHSDSGAPSRSSLQEAALRYLARYASSVAGVRRVLHRKIQRWARTQEDPAPEVIAAAKADAESVLAALVQTGILSDQEFAQMRARSLGHAGQSARSIRARLSLKGIAPDLADTAATVTPDDELAAALVTAKRRRIGPFRGGPPPDAAGHDKDLARLARAGFSLEVAQKALGMSFDEADERIRTFRR